MEGLLTSAAVGGYYFAVLMLKITMPPHYIAVMARLSYCLICIILHSVLTDESAYGSDAGDYLYLYLNGLGGSLKYALV